MGRLYSTVSIFKHSFTVSRIHLQTIALCEKFKQLRNCLGNKNPTKGAEYLKGLEWLNYWLQLWFMYYFRLFKAHMLIMENYNTNQNKFLKIIPLSSINWWLHINVWQPSICISYDYIWYFAYHIVFGT